MRRMLSLAQEWKVLDRVPRVRMSAVLILETGLRVGEAVGLEWPDVHLLPRDHAKLHPDSEGEIKERQAELSLSESTAVMLRARKATSQSSGVSPVEIPESPIPGTSLDHRHADVRTALKLPKEFVLHSLRHTMLSHLGEAGADVFSIMRIAGHSSATVSRRYVRPTPEGLERAFERLQELNLAKFEVAEAETRAEAVGSSVVPANSLTPKKRRPIKSSQVVDFTKKGP